MALEIAGLVIGVLIQFLPQAIKKARDSSIITRAIFDRLENTIVSITPLILQIEEIQEQLDETTGKVIKDLNLLLQKIAHVLEEYAKLNHINFVQRHSYRNELEKLEEELRWKIEVDVQVNQWSDIKQILSRISQNHIIHDSKIDFHVRWNYKKKEHEMRFAVK